MARGKRGRISKVVLFILVIVVIGGALIFAFPSIGNELGIQQFSDLFLVEVDTTATNEQFNFWHFFDEVTRFTLIPNVNLDCFSQTSIKFIDTSGRQSVASSSKITKQPVDTIFSIATIGGLPIRDLEGTGSTTCTIDFGSATVQGGQIITEWNVVDTNNNVKLVKRITKGVPAGQTFSGSTGGTIIHNVADISATEIENAVNLPSTTANKLVPISMKTTINLVFTTSVTGTKINTGTLVLNTGATVNVINDGVTQTPSPTSKVPEITSLTPPSFDYIGSIDPAIERNNQISAGEKLMITIKGTVTNHNQGVDPNPTIAIFSPNGGKRSGDIEMTQVRKLSSTLTEFQVVNPDTTVRFQDGSIIDTFKGTWFAEMKIGNKLDRQNFAVNDARSSITPKQTLTCTSPKVPNESGTACVDPPNTTSSQTCTLTSSKFQASLSSKTDQELITDGKSLDSLFRLGNLSVCKTAELSLIKAELEKRGYNPETFEKTGTGTGATGDLTQSTTFAHFKADFTTTSTETNRACSIQKTIPDQGISLGAFQLAGLGGSQCVGERFSKTEIINVIDFGSVASGIKITDVKLQHRIFFVKNMAFPAEPKFDCVGGKDVPLTAHSCTIKDFDTGEFLPAVGLMPSQVDQSSAIQKFSKGFPNQFILSKIALTEGQIQNAINSVTTLEEGDTFAYLLYTNGVFEGTSNGQPIIGIINPIAITQDFTYTTLDTNCDLKISFIDENGQCLPIPPDECPQGEHFDLDERICKPNDPHSCNPPNSVVNGVCKPPADPSCSPDEIKDPQTGVCRAVFCPAIPTCSSGTTLASTKKIDDCKNVVLECVPIGTLPPVGGGCESGFVLNTLGQCQRIGSGNNGGTDPSGNSENSGFCIVDADFNFSQCLSSIFNGEGEKPPSLTLTGITGQALLVVVMLAVLIIIIAIIIRKYRGGINPF